MHPATKAALAASVLIASLIASSLRGGVVAAPAPASGSPARRLFSATSARSTGQVGYEVGGVTRPLRGPAYAALSGVQCVRVLPGASALTDQTCCHWVRVPGQAGVMRLEARTDWGSLTELPARQRRALRALCTQRAGRPLGGATDAELATGREPQ